MHRTGEYLTPSLAWLPRIISKYERWHNTTHLLCNLIGICTPVGTLGVKEGTRYEKWTVYTLPSRSFPFYCCLSWVSV